MITVLRARCRDLAPHKINGKQQAPPSPFMDLQLNACHNYHWDCEHPFWKEYRCIVLDKSPYWKDFGSYRESTEPYQCSKDGFLKAPGNSHHSVKRVDLERPYLYPQIKFPTSCCECHSFEKGTLKLVSLESNIQEMWWGKAEASADGSLLNPTARWKANVLRALTSNDRHLSKRNFVRTSYKSKDRLWSFLLAIGLVHEVR